MPTALAGQPAKCGASLGSDHSPDAPEDPLRAARDVHSPLKQNRIKMPEDTPHASAQQLSSNRRSDMVDATLVTVHGFWSAPDTWDKLKAEWIADDELKGLRIHSFGYESPRK